MQTTKAAAHEIAVFYTTNGQLATRALYQVAEELAARSGVLTLAEVLRLKCAWPVALRRMRPGWTNTRARAHYRR